MRQTVVGVFDKSAQARQAAQQLRESGFGDSVFVTDEVDEIDEATSSSAAERDTRGVFAQVRSFFAELFGPDETREVSPYAEAVRRGGGIVKVEVDAETEAEAARAALQAAGAIDIDRQAEGWRASGWSDTPPDVDEGLTSMPATNPATGSGAAAGATLAAGSAAAAATTPSATPETTRGDREVLPVVEEALRVGKRVVQSGGVRVYARTVEEPVRESVELRSEHAQVERRPVDRPASEAELQQLGERTVEVRETSEQPVVAKEARVVEEVSVGKTVETRREDIQDTVRRTEVEVEPLSAAEDTAAWRSHFDANLAARGERFEDYEPAYRWGSTMRADPRFGSGGWDEAEPGLRREWERRGDTAGAWERFKAAVRHGWERITR